MRFIKSSIIAIFILFGLTAILFDGAIDPVSATAMGDPIIAPTGVRASDGDYANKVGVHWDTIRGATLYRIYRNIANTAASATDIGATSANYFFDTSANVGQTYFYWVRAENGSESSSLSTADQGIRAFGNIAPGPFAPLNPPIAPAGNELTGAKSYLGKTLFWDEQLSSTRTVACGTCHRPAEGGSDPRTVTGSARSTNPGRDSIFNTADDISGSPGVPQNLSSGTFMPDPIFAFTEQVTGRKAPSYLNSGYSPNGLFWDGRAENLFRDQLSNNVILGTRGALESQTAGPPVTTTEMAHNGRNWTDVATRIQTVRPLALASNIPVGLSTWIGGRTYPELFLEAFGTADVTPSRISMAIASHERTLFSDNAPLDKWAAQIQPLLPQEESGRVLFVNLQCNTCHDGALLTDHQFHNIGVRPAPEDRGRAAVTLNPQDDGRFRTPTLRNVELHAPYMHNGRFQTLEEVVEFYDRGGDFDAPNIDHGVIRPLNLTPQEKADLVTFMKRPLTDIRVQNELPPFDRPQLFTESNRTPVVTGVGRAGSGSFTPQIIAISPPLVGNPNFIVSVSKAIGNAPAVLVVDEADPGVGSSVPLTGSLARITANTQNTGPGNGWASVSVAIPNLEAILGRTFYARWYIEDTGAANAFSVSQAVQFTVFGEASAPPAFSISGRVMTPGGLGLRNAVVAITDSSGVRRTATTSSFGVYQFSNVPTGLNYVIGVSSKRYRFSSQIVSPSRDLANLDFIGLE